MVFVGRGCLSPVPLPQLRGPSSSQPLAFDVPFSPHFQGVAPLSPGLPDWILALSLVGRAILSPVHALTPPFVRIYGKTAQLLYLYKVLRELTTDNEKTSGTDSSRGAHPSCRVTCLCCVDTDNQLPWLLSYAKSW